MKKSYLACTAVVALVGLAGCSATAPFGITSGVQVPPGQAPGTASVTVGQSIGLAAFAYGGLSTSGVTWLAEAGTVTPDGVYTAPSTVGSYKVTATSTSDATQKSTVTVNVRPTLTLSPAALGTFVGEPKTLGGASVPAGFSALSWRVIDGPVGGASVDAVTGAFNATAEGVYTVEATLVGATDIKKTLTVAALAATTTPILSPGSASVTVGSQVQFSASILGATWSASAGSVSASGLFTAPTTAGVVTVTATKGTQTASAQVTVLPANSGVRLAATRNGAPVDPASAIDVVFGPDKITLAATPLLNGVPVTVAASDISWIVSKPVSVVKQTAQNGDLSQPKLDLELVAPKTAASLGVFTVQYRHLPTGFTSSPVTINVQNDTGNAGVVVR